MQEQDTLLAPGDTVQGHYRIEKILGEGGFSTVYLVRDLQAAESEKEPVLFALKALHNQNRQEQIRFAIEGALLKKLDHPALPHFYRIFKNEERSREFILLEYIAGPNLEVLRRQQPDKRFPLSEVLTLLHPVVEAITYLHSQQPPVIHRDIKPANIIVHSSSKSAVLVDFGIAKEYEADATTTAVRHCSPGYGAPEQYSSHGTDLRTDVYGFAATCYTLLTGVTPSDAFHRATTLISRKRDPLVSLSDLVPNIPIYVSQAIERAMSIGQEQRFSTIEDLWFALNTPPVSGPSSLATEDISFISTISSDKTHQQVSQYAQPQRGSLLRTRRVLLPASLLLMLLVVFGGILSLWSYSRNAQPVRPIASSAGSSLNRSSGISTTPTVASSSYTRIKTSYAGTLHDLLADTSSSMSLTHIHQTNERITGSFTNHHAHSTFTGVLDGSQHIFFTVNGDDSHSSIFFEGAVRSDGNLAGNYCNVDKNGQCIGNYGLWSVSPSSA